MLSNFEQSFYSVCGSIYYWWWTIRCALGFVQYARLEWQDALDIAKEMFHVKYEEHPADVAMNECFSWGE